MQDGIKKYVSNALEMSMAIIVIIIITGTINSTPIIWMRYDDDGCHTVRRVARKAPIGGGEGKHLNLNIPH